MKSIMQERVECYLCGSTYKLECHHIFNGALRGKSETVGAKIYLCKKHHEFVHKDAITRIALKKLAQERLMEQNNWTLEDWRKNFSDKSYL